MNRLNLQNIKEFCNSRNIIVTSNYYINNGTKLDLICMNGHSYQMSFSHIQGGQSCPICAGCKKHTIEYVKLFCLQKQFIVHNSNYINNTSKLNLTCPQGHDFNSSFASIKQGSGCPTCHGLSKPNLEKFLILAKNRNAICLSTEYINAKTKLAILCNKCNAIFYICTNNINNGKWCPNCASSKSEKCCRLAIETIFGKSFPKIRPDWLKNTKTNYPLELDGFNEELKIAFEHQGGYHYRIVSKYKMSNNDLINIRERDLLKQNLCNKQNVHLIIIPELFAKTKLNTLDLFIKSECEKQNIIVPEYNKNDINYNRIYF